MPTRFQGEAILRRLRDEGRSVTWFCQRVGVSRVAFYRWTLGERVPTEKHRRRMAEVLGVAESAIFLADELPSGSESLPFGITSEAVPA